MIKHYCDHCSEEVENVFVFNYGDKHQELCRECLDFLNDYLEGYFH